jgi:hypothetical protein
LAGWEEVIHLSTDRHTVLLGLARIIYMHRIWPYIRWFCCQKYRMCTPYV